MKTSKEFEYWHDFLHANDNRVKDSGIKHYDYLNNTFICITKRAHHTLIKNQHYLVLFMWESGSLSLGAVISTLSVPRAI